MPSDISSIKPILDANSQSHLYKFWEELSSIDKDKYFNELLSLNTKRVNSAFQDALKVAENSCFVDGRLMCPDPSTCGHATSLRSFYPDEYELFVSKGVKAISERKVAVILLAGGQGTRLESTNPKGMYDIGLPSKRTLFQIQAERLLSLCRQVSAKCGQEIYIPWYIMTSDQTQKLTEDFFRENGYFNYPHEQIIFFEQFGMPVLSFQGKILMKDKASLCWSPEGNGGLYRALLDRGILQNMKTRGIEYVHIYGVDNVLVRLADPAFIGFCISRSADCAVKVVEKTDPNEPIGVVGVVDGKFRVVEYSEISPSTAALVLPMPPSRMVCCQDEGDCKSKLNKSRLLYCFGNICNHFMTLTFLERVCSPELESQLPYHVARKKVPHLDLESGTTVTPTQPNALKLEKFIFDVFQFSQRFFIWEVDRATEFSPLKNRSGAPNDSPETCRQSILKEHASWVKAAGGLFASEDNVNRDVIEISPLVSLNGENLEFLKGKTITGVNILELRQNGDGKDVPTLIQVTTNN